MLIIGFYKICGFYTILTTFRYCALRIFFSLCYQQSGTAVFRKFSKIADFTNSTILTMVGGGGGGGGGGSVA